MPIPEEFALNSGRTGETTRLEAGNKKEGKGKKEGRKEGRKELRDGAGESERRPGQGTGWGWRI